MTRKPISIERLLNSALGADAMMGPDFKREVDLTPKERERPEAWRRWARQRRRRSAVFVPTGGKTRMRSCATWPPPCARLGCSRNSRADRLAPTVAIGDPCEHPYRRFHARRAPRCTRDGLAAPPIRADALAASSGRPAPAGRTPSGPPNLADNSCSCSLSPHRVPPGDFKSRGRLVSPAARGTASVLKTRRPGEQRHYTYGTHVP